MKMYETRGPLLATDDDFFQCMRKAALAVARLRHRIAVATDDTEKIKRALNAVKQAECDHRYDAERNG